MPYYNRTYNIRKPYDSEDKYFRENPHVAGMAAEDGRIILNTYSGRSPEELEAVARNESARLYMREMGAPKIKLTKSQMDSMKGYGSEDDIRATILARIYSGDPSAGDATEEQRRYVEDVLRREVGPPRRIR